MSTKAEQKTEEQQGEEPMFCKVDDVNNFMEQVVIALLSIVNGINSSMDELKNNRSETSDDN